MTQVQQIMTIVAIAFLQERMSLAGDQSCWPNNWVNEFQLSNEPDLMEDQVVPKTHGRPVPKDGLNCTWKIINNHPDDLIVALSGFNRTDRASTRDRTKSEDAATKSQLLSYRLHSNYSNSSCSAASTKDMLFVKRDTLHVLQMSRGSHLEVFVRLNQASSGSHKTQALRIRTMESGFCSPEIVNFNDSCYTSSSAQRSLQDELAAMSGDSGLINLASFASYRALRDFVKQSKRTRVGSGLHDTRSKEPLDLSGNLRIGIFYEHRTSKIFYLNNSGDKCEMAEFHDAHRLNYTLPQKVNFSISCGSLRAKKATADSPSSLMVQVDFTHCNRALPALISFPDKARNQCKNCAVDVLSWIQNAEASPTIKYEPSFELNEAGGKDAKILPRTILRVAFIAMFLLLMALTLSWLLRFFGKIRQQ